MIKLNLFLGALLLFNNCFGVHRVDQSLNQMIHDLFIEEKINHEFEIYDDPSLNSFASIVLQNYPSHGFEFFLKINANKFKLLTKEEQKAVILAMIFHFKRGIVRPFIATIAASSLIPAAAYACYYSVPSDSSVLKIIAGLLGGYIGAKMASIITSLYYDREKYLADKYVVSRSSNIEAIIGARSKKRELFGDQ